MLRTLAGVGLGFAGGLWLRRRQHEDMSEALGVVTDSMNGVLAATSGLDVEATIEISLGSVWRRTCGLREISPSSQDEVLAPASKLADVCRLTAAEAMQRTLTAVSFGSELGPLD